jgi:tRNA(adenine34) deaminase
VGEHSVPVAQFYPEHGPGKHGHDLAFYLNLVIRHKVDCDPPQIPEGQETCIVRRGVVSPILDSRVKAKRRINPLKRPESRPVSANNTCSGMSEIPPCPFEKRFPSQLNRDDAFYMALAYNRAIDAWNEDEVPIGAVIEYAGEVIGSAGNRVSATGDPTAHAEILALTQAYVTKEPCPMCSGACIMSRVSRVVHAFADPKMGCLGGATDLNALPGSNHRFEVHCGVMEKECLQLVQAYFQAKRA